MGYGKIETKQGKRVTEEDVRELFAYLTEGEVPDGVTIPRSQHPRLSRRKAYSVIWFLQEHLELLPDVMNQCCKCGDLMNTDREGVYIESTGRLYCEGCAPA